MKPQPIDEDRIPFLSVKIPLTYERFLILPGNTVVMDNQTFALIDPSDIDEDGNIIDEYEWCEECRECGAEAGQFHAWGCSAEVCIVCGYFAQECDCILPSQEDDIHEWEYLDEEGDE